MNKYKIEAMPSLLSAAQVAERLGIDYSTARRWLNNGRFKSVEIAGKIFAYEDEIDAIVNQLRETISVRETAAKIDRAERTVNHMLTVTGELKGVKFMRRWYVKTGSVDEYLRKRGENCRV